MADPSTNTPETEVSGMSFFTYLIIILIALAIGVGGTLFITKPGAANAAKKAAIEASIADSTAAEKVIASLKDTLAELKYDLSSCEEEYNTSKEELDTLRPRLAVLDSTLKATVESKKLPAGVTPKSKPR